MTRFLNYITASGVTVLFLAIVYPTLTGLHHIYETDGLYPLLLLGSVAVALEGWILHFVIEGWRNALSDGKAEIAVF